MSREQLLAMEEIQLKFRHLVFTQQLKDVYIACVTYKQSSFKHQSVQQVADSVGLTNAEAHILLQQLDYIGMMSYSGYKVRWVRFPDTYLAWVKKVTNIA